MNFKQWMLILESQSKVEYLIKKYPSVSPDIINNLNYIDGKNLEWLVRQVASKKIRYPEDNDRTKNALKLFNQLKQKPSLLKKYNINPDINKYNLHDLEDLESKIKQQDNAPIAHNIKDEGGKTIYNDGRWQIIELTDPQMVCNYSKGSKWCTNKFKTAEMYVHEGPIYIIFENGNKVAQYHKESEQLMDLKDREYHNKELAKILSDLNLASFTLLRDNLLIDEIAKNPEYAIEYAIPSIFDDRKENHPAHRFEKGEKAIATVPKYALWYAKFALKGKFPLGEPAIATDNHLSLDYAVLINKNNKDKYKERFYLGEPAIATDPRTAFMYARDITRKPFPEGEDAMAKDPQYAYSYAKYVLKAPFPKGENAIATHANYAEAYAHDVLKGRFLKGEPAIAKNGEASLYYAQDIIHGRFELGEPEIFKDDYFKKHYLRFLKSKNIII